MGSAVPVPEKVQRRAWAKALSSRPPARLSSSDGLAVIILIFYKIWVTSMIVVTDNAETVPYLASDFVSFDRLVPCD